MTQQLDELKRACQEKLAHKKGDLYGREQLRADMAYSFATTPDKILSLIDSHEQLQSKLDKACAALELAEKYLTDRGIRHKGEIGRTIVLPKIDQALAEIRKKDDNG